MEMSHSLDAIWLQTNPWCAWVDRGGLVHECLPAMCVLLQAFDTVGWLDLTAAKVRFGLWLGGVMPAFTPWEQVFDRRPAGAPFGAPLPPGTGAAQRVQDRGWGTEGAVH